MVSTGAAPTAAPSRGRAAALGAAGTLAVLVIGGSQALDLSTTTPTHSSSRRVTVSGSAKGLLPGGTVRLDATIRNRGSRPLLVDDLTVVIVKVDRRHRACALENYEPVAYSGPLPLVVPARTTRRLSQLGVPVEQRPGVTMPDRPWPQNACLGAKLTLTYTGTARIESGGGSHHDDDHDDDDDDDDDGD